MTSRLLLACGILAPLIYVASDIFAALSWDGYSYSAQSVSELRAIGAPTRPLLMPVLQLYALLELAFGLGVMRVARVRKGLRRSGALLIALGLLDHLGRFFPMHARGEATNSSDVMHIALTFLTVFLFLLILCCAASAAGRWFRLYTWATLLALIGFGVWAFLDAPTVAAGLPTPWLGIRERINIYSYMLWLLVLASVLLAAPAEPVRPGESAALTRSTP